MHYFRKQLLSKSAPLADPAAHVALCQGVLHSQRWCGAAQSLQGVQGCSARPPQDVQLHRGMQVGAIPPPLCRRRQSPHDSLGPSVAYRLLLQRRRCRNLVYTCTQWYQHGVAAAARLQTCTCCSCNVATAACRESASCCAASTCPASPCEARWASFTSRRVACRALDAASRAPCKPCRCAAAEVAPRRACTASRLMAVSCCRADCSVAHSCSASATWWCRGARGETGFGAF